jgi:uncharacterized lipoprotein NlpE involved in copper resistance
LKKVILIVFAVIVATVIGSNIYAGSGACTKCDCKAWVQKSKYHGNAGEPHAYCKCGHFWSSHR